jgi:hypothetical protein
MSSVTRFIRQVPVSTTYYSANSIIGGPFSPGANITNAYQFIPDGSNYVGNYPPGFMTQASPGSGVPAGVALYNAINELGNNPALILRDMGKTIKARYDTAGAIGTLSDGEGFFREVQLLNPGPLGTAAGTSVIGGTNGSAFGVLGAAPTYLTFYISVTVAGVRGPAPTVPTYAIAGGQM